ncbi:MAG: NAD-dependent epimerase/dehydratase family protein [Dehalococcoidia bacterium]|nr:MAG: NAD-dependent epimerase/dehydratase family protein [Dehalococcoidia bacterium]
MIVVTGATGHIGNVLVRELLAQGQVVRALVMPADDLRPLEGLEVEIVYGDVTHLPSLKAAFTAADVVFHLAGIVSIMPSMRPLLEDVNVRGTRNVIDACRATSVRRLIYTSSVHAIAEPPPGTVIDESQPFAPDRVLGDYARSKARATLLLLDEVRKGGLDAVVCCPTGIIGPRDYKVSNVGQLILDFASGRLKSYVRGAYDFVDVRDVARGLILVAERGESGSHYILSGAQVQVPELMKELERDVGHRAPAFEIPARIARAAGVLASLYYRLLRRRPVFTAYSIDVLKSNSQISSARAREELGFTSRPWQNSIRDHVEWFRSEGMLPARR